MLYMVKKHIIMCWEDILRPEFRQLRLEQTDRALQPFAGTRSVSRPRRGWLRAVREALGITRQDVARAMRRFPQNVSFFEKSESADRITLQTLRRYAEAMDCQLVYAIVPKAGTLTEAVEERARKKAEKEVRAVEHTMALEDQATTGTEEKIAREAKRILKKG